MKFTTKRNRWYFLRELFSYMIPVVLIVWSLDVFLDFMKCPLHPENSAPCRIIRIKAAIYWLFLIIIIILTIFASKKLKKIKKKIENEFLETTNNYKEIQQEKETTKKIKENKKNKRIVMNSDNTLKEKSTNKKTRKNLKKL